ncbi:T9SS type A sorting domain-containing protein [Flavobacterium sp. GSP27]|uniref:T9SS-dependent M36 family metallopeptidase n=1 Tax=Flavobacterium sp. GSP27 TaxID=2497489 RepID=UPI000F819359|nr:T9SS-dependent M36 family metallopeptidase [Flavobacterium sp. GSP27]RTZ10173.1 T9SS type A sorting domain-containing protein [Flavobacterium sp. GSP27]
MKKIILFLVFLTHFFALGQSNDLIIQHYLNTPNAKINVSKSDFKDWVIQSDGGATSSGIQNCYVVQRYKGIEIFRAVSNFSIQNSEVIDVQKRIVDGVSKKVNTTKPSLSAVDALTKAYSLLGMKADEIFTVIENKEAHKFKISNGLGIQEPVTANLVFHQASNGKLILAWDFTIYTPTQDHIWSVRIDATDGGLLEKNDFVISCSFDHSKAISHSHESWANSFDSSYKQIFSASPTQTTSGSYRVIPFNFESPNHSAFQLVSNPANSHASPFGWHDVDGVAGHEFTITRGNNVWAKEDFVSTNSTSGFSPSGGASLLFDFPYGGTNVQASTYIDAAITNLFYMNNVMHDVWYQYGFDEANGNFQVNNYNRGGKDTDHVNADAQDGSLVVPMSLNNANFSTPVDGSSGRMQMFLWDRGPEIKPIIINSPASIAGSYVARQNSFNPGRVDLPVAPNFLQSDVVLYLDSTGGTSQGCVAPSNAAAMSGKIVVLRRGSCTFVVKVKAAQNAGAIAVIVVNNADGDLIMSGADESITIPAISVTQSVGENIITQMQTQAVNIKIQLEASPFINSDGDFDNGIIAHEYGHGISTRLAGGSNNSSCLNNADQMGEGWSDWFALMMQIKPGDSGGAKRGIGTFVSSQAIDGRGIRDFQYSTDRAINPMTYASTNNYQFIDAADMVSKTSVHGVGSVWATMLWDLTWAYINKYDFDNNKYTGSGGNNRIMRIVLDGIKLQVCSPTFVDARNAIIAADQAITGGKDFCLIWEVFAARGLGVNASAGDNNVGNDQAEDFTRPASGPNCALAVDNFESDVMRVFPNPSKGPITIKIDQYSGRVNIQVIDLNGRVLYDVKNQEFSRAKSIDLSALATGIYILDIKGENLHYVEKIIKN